ncbi:MAG: hypothetical protein QGH74_08330 [Candidatus Brocadiia bacterium]|jgi:hypothetical protein|nr:hypothetical protein [Candidatus Brocadiia bacterium]
MPTNGIDAVGADTYAEVIAAPAGNVEYRNISLACETNDAMVSLDAGATDHIHVKAGLAPLMIEGVPIKLAIHGKNQTGGSNYAGLVINVW